MSKFGISESNWEKLQGICESAPRIIADITELQDKLMELTDDFCGLETEIFDNLRTLTEVKRDYQTLKDMKIERVENG